MTLFCFSRHSEYIYEWPNGIRICLLCAAKHEMAQSLKSLFLRIKLGWYKKEAA